MKRRRTFTNRLFVFLIIQTIPIIEINIITDYYKYLKDICNQNILKREIHFL